MFILFVSGLLAVNSGGIKGFVLNAENGAGIENVDVVIENTILGTGRIFRVRLMPIAYLWRIGMISITKKMKIFG